MREFRRAWYVGLLLALFLWAIPAQAATDWRKQYAAELKQSAGAKKIVALCDLTGDAFPEMVMLAVSASGESVLWIYEAKENSAALLALDVPLAMKGVKKATVQWHEGEGGMPAIFVSLTGANTLKCAAYQYKSGEMKQIFVSQKQRVKSKTQYEVDGKKVSANQYKAATRTFGAENRKVKQLPLMTVTKKDRSATIDRRVAALAKKYATYGQVKTIALNKTSVDVHLGESFSLEAKCKPLSAFTDKVEWISENEYIATVDAKGKVQTVGMGSVKIYARTHSGAQKVCEVQVRGPKPTKVSIEPTEVAIIKGGSAALTMTLEPANADPTAKWSSSNKGIATVDKNGLIKGIAEGKATITLSVGDKLTASCDVVVTARPAVVVDISQHNDSSKMDWAKIAKNVDLLILRCGVTRTDTNPIGIGKDAKFATYAQQCKKYKIPFGVYYYGKSSDIEGVKAEAKMAWDVASPYDPLFYVYDVEESRLTKELIETYNETIKTLGAKKTGYYIAHHLYSKYKLDTSKVDFIWIPHYGKNTGQIDSTPAYPCDIHQYTSKGRIEGFAGNIDINRLMGKKDLAWYLKR